ncbi:MAG: hypothetical protein ACYCOX_02785 [Acidobacteriaceae bacterium]
MVGTSVSHTDKNGNFDLTGFEGYDYILRADIYGVSHQSWSDRPNALAVGYAVRLENQQRRATSGEEPVMKEKTRFLGLDVHAETIAVAVDESNGEVRSLGNDR